MKPSSSTSASERGGSRFLLVFFGTSLALILGANYLLNRAYLHYRYRPKQSEWALKTERLQARVAKGEPVEWIILGDSTLSCGIAASLLRPEAQNLAWSGFEPSEFTRLSAQLATLPQRPTRLFIGINPSFLSQNEWRNTADLPYGSVLREGMRDFYEDSNSLKPLVLMGGISAFTARFLKPPSWEHKVGTAVFRSTVLPDGLYRDEQISGPPSKPPTEVIPDQSLPFRETNFELLQRFVEHQRSLGTRVTWIHMPYSHAFTYALQHGPKATRFMKAADARLGRIFPGDIIDLRDAATDVDFTDQAHLNRLGAERVTLALKREIERLDGRS